MATFSTRNNKPIRWQDKQGFIHAVEGSEVHPGVTLLWTLCERDVPANAAHTGHDAVSCATCRINIR